MRLSDFMRDPLGIRGAEPWVAQRIMRTLPEVWVQTDPRKAEIPYTNEYKHKKEPLTIVIGGETMKLGDQYMHLFASRSDRAITLAELQEMKETFLGDVMAYHVLLPKAAHDRIGPNSAHLWYRANPPVKKFHVPAGADEASIIGRVEHSSQQQNAKGKPK